MWQYTNFKERVCTMCGVTFKPNSGSQKVCSKACSLTRQRRYDRNKNGRKALCELECEVCGQMFMQIAGGQKMCSKECSKKKNSDAAKIRNKELSNTGIDCGIRRDIAWNMDTDPWDTFKSGCYGFVRDVELCPLG